MSLKDVLAQLEEEAVGPDATAEIKAAVEHAKNAITAIEDHCKALAARAGYAAGGLLADARARAAAILGGAPAAPATDPASTAGATDGPAIDKTVKSGDGADAASAPAE